MTTTKSDMTKTERELSAAILRVKPARLVVYCGDADETGKGVAVSKGRNCAQHAMKVVARMSWTRVDLVDKSGDVLATVDNVEPARDLVDLPEGKGLTEHALALKIVALVNQERNAAVELALAHRDKETKAIMDATTQMLKEQALASRNLAELYREYGDVAREAANERADARVEAASAEAGGMDKLVESLAPALLPLLGPIIQRALSGITASPDVPPNGHRKGS